MNTRTSPSSPDKGTLGTNDIHEVLADNIYTFEALNYLSRDECKSMRDAAKKVLTDALVIKLKNTTCHNADEVEKFDHVAARQVVASLPGFDKAVFALESKMEDKIREGVVPAVSEAIKLQIRNAIPGVVMTPPLYFWAVSTWLNMNVRPDFGTWLILMFGIIGVAPAYSAISDVMFEKNMKALAAKGLPRFNFKSLAEANWLTGKFMESAVQLLKKIPSGIAEELKRSAERVINIKRLRAMMIALSLTTPFAYDRMVTEPAEEQYVQAMIHQPIRALEKLEEKMSAPNATVNMVKKLLSEGDENLLVEQESAGDLVKTIAIEPNFLMPGNGCNNRRSGGMPNITRDYRTHFVRIDEIGGWIDKDGREIILPVPDVMMPWYGTEYEKNALPIFDKAIPGLNLSYGEMEACFGKEKPEFGVRIDIENSSVKTVAIMRSGKNITTIEITPESSMTIPHADKLSAAFTSFAQEMKKQKGEIAKAEYAKTLPPSAPTSSAPAKINKKDKKKKK